MVRSTEAFFLLQVLYQGLTYAGAEAMFGETLVRIIKSGCCLSVRSSINALGSGCLQNA